MPSFLLFEIYFSTMSALYVEIAFELDSTKIQNCIFKFMYKNAWLAAKKKSIFLINLMD